MHKVVLPKTQKVLSFYNTFYFFRIRVLKYLLKCFIILTAKNKLKDGDLVAYYPKPSDQTAGLCLRGCLGCCHGSLRFWQISLPYLNQPAERLCLQFMPTTLLLAPWIIRPSVVDLLRTVLLGAK